MALIASSGLLWISYSMSSMAYMPWLSSMAPASFTSLVHKM